MKTNVYFIVYSLGAALNPVNVITCVLGQFCGVNIIDDKAETWVFTIGLQLIMLLFLN